VNVRNNMQMCSLLNYILQYDLHQHLPNLLTKFDKIYQKID